MPTLSPIRLETLRRFDRPGPRYTSYPTAVEFDDAVGDETYRDKLAEADGADSDAPLSLYVHIPFCRKHCDFCACHVIATPHRTVAEQYLDYLEREIAIVAGRLPHRRDLIQIHWGGGTPTYLSSAEVERLYRALERHFDVLEGAEIGIEVDPRVTTREHLLSLAELGFNRLSMGVQDPDDEVQQAIGRGQTWSETVELIESAREIGFSEGINCDLVYGLPRQRQESWEESLDDVIELRPDRLAVYSFAFVPWMKFNQKRLTTDDFPSPKEKLELYLAALNRFLAAGYEPIGMDHFALPDDELAVAARQGRLERNFMGYTVKPVSTMIGLGVSAIGDLEGAYFQNEKKLSTYYAALDRDRLPIERGRLLDDDDLLRRDVIMQIMCNFGVDKRRVEERYRIDFDDYFAASLARLADLEEEGFVVDTAEAIEVRGAGRLFVRNAAMAFDRYLAEKQQQKPTFSRTV
ncbi:MAG: oxygen-independent coproporphyrinogen III oxidase [Thermoanaerobaculia bacterium]|nr:oxygen-independent coproporphyrinogen III oxidase [Thermoanaerobaculia bacterium]